MLAAHRDQENLVHSRQVPTKTQGGTIRPLQHKTPLKVPLNDENIGTGKAGTRNHKNENTIGKTLGTKQKQVLATPLDSRVRAPLGAKTTNAKAQPGALPTVKDRIREFEKTQPRPTTSKKHRQKTITGPSQPKIEVRTDQQVPPAEPEVEYAPPSVKNAPYESDVFPDCVLTFEGLKPENLMRGYYEHYFDPVDENGVHLSDKEFEERQQQALKNGDDKILEDIQNTDWSISDVPESRSLVGRKAKNATPLPTTIAGIKAHAGIKNPGTIVSRSAANALSMSTVTKKARPRLPTNLAQPKKMSLFPVGRSGATIAPSVRTAMTTDGAVGEVASRSTLGYSKGRSASSMVNSRVPAMSRAASAASSNSGRAEVVPRRPEAVPHHGGQDLSLGIVRPPFLSIFGAADTSDDEEFGFDARIDEDEEDDFQLSLEG